MSSKYYGAIYNEVNFLPIQITVCRKKIGLEDRDISPIENMSNEIHLNNVDFFDYQKYVKQCASRQRQFLPHQNYVEERTLKQRRFFAHQNYIKKVRQNDVAIHWYFHLNVST